VGQNLSDTFWSLRQESLNLIYWRTQFSTGKIIGVLWALFSIPRLSLCGRQRTGRVIVLHVIRCQNWPGIGIRNCKTRNNIFSVAKQVMQKLL